MNNRFKKGKKAEEVVRKACEELLLENKIAGFEKYDEPGIDFLLFFDKQNPLKIKVKSSQNSGFFYSTKYGTKVLILPIKRENFPERRKKKLIRMMKNRIIEIIEMRES